MAENGQTRVARLADRLDALERLRLTLGYEATLGRGYAVVRDGTGAVVPRKAAANKADTLEIQFADGVLPVSNAGASTQPAPKKAHHPKKPSDDQGSLF